MTIEATTLSEKAAGAQPAMKLAVTSAKAPAYVEGRRTFFKYRDLHRLRADDLFLQCRCLDGHDPSSYRVESLAS